MGVKQSSKNGHVMHYIIYEWPLIKDMSERGDDRKNSRMKTAPRHERATVS